MKVEIQPNEGYTVLRLIGDFETYAIGEFLEAVEEVREEGEKYIVLNMRRVKFINSTGIGAVLKVRKELLAAGGGLALARSSAFVKDIFNKLGLDSVLPQYDEEEDAADALSEEEIPDALPAVPVEEDAALFFRFYDQERADLLGGRGVGAGEILLLDPKGLTFEWGGRGQKFDDPELKAMFEAGTELELKFRLPLYKKSTYFECNATVDSVEVGDGAARVVTTFTDIDDEAAQAVQQYVADISLVRQEVDEAKRNV